MEIRNENLKKKKNISFSPEYKKLLMTFLKTHIKRSKKDLWKSFGSLT